MSDISEQLRDAIIRGDVPCTARILHTHPELRISFDSQGRTPMHNAVYGRQPAIIDLLLSLNVSIDISDHWGCPPLNYACRDTDVEMVRFLLSRGSRAVGLPTCVRSPVLEAARSHNEDRNDVIELLQAKGATVDFHSAVCLADQVQLSLLLSQSPELIRRWPKPGELLGDALAFANSSTITFLLKNGLDIKKAEREGPNPVMMALQTNVGVLELLLQYGADPNSSYRGGPTALEAAQQNAGRGVPGYAEAVALLIRSGAR